MDKPLSGIPNALENRWVKQVITIQIQLYTQNHRRTRQIEGFLPERNKDFGDFGENAIHGITPARQRIPSCARPQKRL
jgi:hypothetical protein